jgi:hypothetical protein
MSELLKAAMKAHGGLSQWQRFTAIEATVIVGGPLLAMKGQPQAPSPMRVTAT